MVNYMGIRVNVSAGCRVRGLNTNVRELSINYLSLSDMNLRWRHIVACVICFLTVPIVPTVPRCVGNFSGCVNYDFYRRDIRKPQQDGCIFAAESTRQRWSV